jgi:hypothetical protein
MKNLKSLLLPAALALLAVATASAQTVDGYGFAIARDYQQTSSSAPSLITNPYSISAFVEGPSLSGTYTFSHSGTAASGVTIPASGIYRNFESIGYASIGDLNTAYAAPFSMSISHSGGPTTVNYLDLTGDAFPLIPAISGGTWSGGKLQVTATSPYTLNFNTFGAGGINWNNVELYIDFTPGIGGTYDQQSTPGVGTNQFLIPANAMTAGNTYNAELLFIHRVDVDDEAAIAGAFGFSAYVSAVSFQIQAVSAVPEPSTYAALAGVAALGLAMWHRRRKLQAAA